ncbi:hypothetical protein [Persicimonas caeni]|nr:hypothetical protein [Persicimonas caeni]
MHRVEEHVLGWARRRGRLGVAHVLLPMLLVVALFAAPACTTGEPAEDKQPVEQTQPVRPGAQAWQEHALELPANSPVVFWTRSDRLLEAMAGLRDWLFAEPAMFGPNGAQMVAQAQSEWNVIVREFGMDPLEAPSWEKIGLDPSREIYVGVYPVAEGSGSEFVAAFEEAIRGEFEFPEENDLLDSLTTMTMLAQGDLPKGVHSAVAGDVAAQAPLHGFRVVVPIVERETFLESIDELMVGMEYAQFAVEAEGDEQSRRIFYDLDADWPGVMLRVDGELAIFDVVARQLSRRVSIGDAKEAALEAIKARLTAAATKIDSGRPAAPRSPDTPALGVAADQDGAGDYAKLRGYRQALRFAEAAAVAQRDLIFLENVKQALRSARNWSLASGELTGVSYGLFTGPETDGFFRLNVTLFGAGDEEGLAVSETPIGLGVDQRGLAMSLDMLPVTDKAWQSFIGVSDPETVLQGFAAADFDPSFFALSVPRSLAVLFANTEKMLEDYFVGSLEPLFENRRAFRRLEVASAGIDMRGLRIQPRLVGLVLLDEEAGEDERQKLADGLVGALGDVVSNLDAPQESDANADKAKPDKVVKGELVELEAAGVSAPVMYYFGETGGTPFMFFSYGLAKEASQAELDAVSKREEREPHTFLVRAEPVALFSLMTVFDPTLFEPLDVSILTQRLGALVFAVEPEVVDGVQTIRYDFELQRPPSLD